MDTVYIGVEWWVSWCLRAAHNVGQHESRDQNPKVLASCKRFRAPFHPVLERNEFAILLHENASRRTSAAQLSSNAFPGSSLMIWCGSDFHVCYRYVTVMLPVCSPFLPLPSALRSGTFGYIRCIQQRLSMGFCHVCDAKGLHPTFTSLALLLQAVSQSVVCHHALSKRCKIDTARQWQFCQFWVSCCPNALLFEGFWKSRRRETK